MEERQAAQPRLHSPAKTMGEGRPMLQRMRTGRSRWLLAMRSAALLPSARGAICSTSASNAQRASRRRLLSTLHRPSHTDGCNVIIPVSGAARMSPNAPETAVRLHAQLWRMLVVVASRALVAGLTNQSGRVGSIRPLCARHGRGGLRQSTGRTRSLTPQMIRGPHQGSLARPHGGPCFRGVWARMARCHL
jgi:hypothetical protein